MAGHRSKPHGFGNHSSRLTAYSQNPDILRDEVRPKIEMESGMKFMSRIVHRAGIAAALIAGLALSACANKQANDAMASAGVASPGSQQDFVVNVGDRVFFESDSTELSMQSRSTLDKQAQWLQQYANYTFTIEGHADERGTREYNIALGARRAQAVRDYLAAQGIQTGRMRTVSFGKERPVAVCNDISCWSQNRRAVTVLGATS
jgi:peptidoglycan-associated lipoprotein